MSSPSDAFIIGYYDDCYFDQLPRDLFAAADNKYKIEHLMLGDTPKDYCSAKAVLTLKGSDAILRYDAIPGDDQFVPGMLRLRFSDASRKTLLEGAWVDEGSSASQPVKVNLAMPWKPTQKKLVETGKRKRDVVVRKGQPEFRAEVTAGYCGRCAITGCSVSAALEAAHISPYSHDGNQSPSNGILLRRDLHALFDADLLGLNPEDFTVALGRAASCDTYATLICDQHGEPRRWKPSTTKGFAPDLKALRNRWATFQANNARTT